MALEGSISLSVVEDVLKQHGSRMCDIDLASRKEEQAAMRRYEAAAWLRRMVGIVGVRDFPEEPTEEEFRLGLRNGILLCNALNKVQPGAVSKVIEASADSASLPDGAALSAFQYFENLRNFLDALEELALPTFEASDLQQGGKGSRVVNSILALKSYGEKQARRNGSSKSGGIVKHSSTGKHFVRRNSEPFMYSLPRSQPIQDGGSLEQNFSIDFSVESSEMISPSLSMLVRTLISDKKPEEVPLVVESMLTKVMQDFEHHIARKQEMMDKTLKEINETSLFYGANNSKEIQPTCCVKQVKVIDEIASLHESSNLTEIQSTPCENKVNMTDETGSLYEASNSSEIQNTCFENKMPESESSYTCPRDEDFTMSLRGQEQAKEKLLKQCLLIEKQKREIDELKYALVATRESVEFLKTQYSEEFNNLGKHMQILTHAASGYQKVLEENRKLYNHVQDLKGNIRVYCRVRPFLPGKPSNNLTTVDHLDDGSITISTPTKYGKEGHKLFSFNRVFGPSVTQEEVFCDTKPLIRSILDGYNVCIFAYGQTGSGKTYTMSGPKELTEEDYGVNYRALNDLFQISRQRKDTICYEISVQMIEIYNEQVRDLLNDGPHKNFKTLDIRNSSQNGMAVPDANLVPVTSTEEVIELMNLGQKNRAVCSTSMNERSSRSHSCLTIHVHGRELASGSVLRGCLHLVDLAGSERVNKSEVKGDRLKEAQHINKSLAALGDVIYALAQKNSHVPYRNSKLTQLLQDSLGGQAKTLMFIHISPEVDALSETLSTLKFAERVATIELGAAKMNKDNGELKELRQQVASLRVALAKKEEETLGSTMSSPDIYTMKSSPTSPGCPNQIQTMEDLGNIESCSALMERANIDVANDEDPLRDWVGDNVHVPDSLDQGYIPDVRVFRDRRTSRPNSFTTDDSDEFDFAVSDSLEQEMILQSQSSNGKASNAVNGGSRIKQPQTGSTKGSELRTPRTHMPSPSRKTSTAPPSSQLVKGSPARQQASDGKRRQNGNGRMATSK